MKALLLWLLLASQAFAQSVDTFFNGADARWETLRARHPWMQKIDDTDWKTWLCHAAITVGVGHVLALAPYIDRRLGMRIMLGWYGAREAWNIAYGGNKKRLDPVMDVLTPYTAYRVVLYLNW